MSKLISKLPEDVRVVALQRQREEAKDWDKNTDLLSIAFHFSKTPEDAGIWWNVYYGNYTPFREFHAKQKQSENNGWISVEERLPQDHLNVIVHTTDCETTIAWYSLSNECWMQGCNFYEYNVTHWQPLPEPPKN
jgi:hypothetical protein